MTDTKKLGFKAYMALGGDKFSQTTGIKVFDVRSKSLHLHLPKNNSKCNRAMVCVGGTGNYDLMFFRRHKSRYNNKPITICDIYVAENISSEEQLQLCFTGHYYGDYCSNRTTRVCEKVSNLEHLPKHLRSLSLR